MSQFESRGQASRRSFVPYPKPGWALACPAGKADHRSEAGTGNAPQTGAAIMKLRAPLIAAGAAVVLGATGGFLLPAVATFLVLNVMLPSSNPTVLPVPLTSVSCAR